MNLSAEQKALLRQGLLMQLEAAAPVSVPLATLLQGVRLAGFDRVLDYELVQDLDYLTGKGLVVEVSEEISKGLKRWKLSAAGREHLEERGLC